MDNRLKIIASHFGSANQFEKLFEESQEVKDAYIKLKEANSAGKTVYNAYRDHLVEEIVDTKLVLEQIIHLLDCDEEIEQWTEFKIQRTLKRMGGVFDERSKVEIPEI